MKKFYEIYSKQEILSVLENKFILKYKYKLKNDVCVSKKYKIFIRNINEIEIGVLSDSLTFKIFKILSMLECVTELFDDEKIRIIRKKYLTNITNFSDNTIIRYDLDGSDEYDIFDKVIKIIKKYNKYINLNDIEKSSRKISKLYLADALVLYSDNEEEINKLILKNTKYTLEDIYDFTLYEDFIYRYIELWNAINFNQHTSLGIKIVSINTHLNTILDLWDIKKYDLYDECLKVFELPKQIDIDNDLLFYFIVKRFPSGYYLDDNNKILLYVSLIELLLTHKQKGKDDSIISQLRSNLLLCVDKYKKITISKKEINLLYEYRSILSHGNFEKIHEVLRKIKKLDFAKELIKELDYEEMIKFDSFVVALIRIRTLELFSFVYQIYCKDSLFIDNLKSS